jgi:hypothetical protein
VPELARATDLPTLLVGLLPWRVTKSLGRSRLRGHAPAIGASASRRTCSVSRRGMMQKFAGPLTMMDF